MFNSTFNSIDSFFFSKTEHIKNYIYFVLSLKTKKNTGCNLNKSNFIAMIDNNTSLSSNDRVTTYT